MKNLNKNEWSAEIFSANDASRFESEKLAGIVVSQMAQSCCCGGNGGHGGGGNGGNEDSAE